MNGYQMLVVNDHCQIMLLPDIYPQLLISVYASPATFYLLVTRSHFFD